MSWPAGEGENFQKINMYIRLFPFVARKSFRFTICKKKQNQPGQVKGKEGGGGGDEDGGQVELLLPHLFSNGGSFNSFLYF